MNTQISDGLLKFGVGLQTMTTADWKYSFGSAVFALFKHLVQISLIVLVGLSTYALVNNTEWAVASIPAALLVLALGIKLFYFSGLSSRAVAGSFEAVNKERLALGYAALSYAEWLAMKNAKLNLMQQNLMEDDDSNRTNPIYSHRIDNIWHDMDED